MSAIFVSAGGRPEDARGAHAASAVRLPSAAVFYLLSKLLDVLLSPYTWGVALLAAAVPWRGGARAARRWRLRRALGALGVAVLVLASMPPVSNAMLWRLERASPSTYRDDVTYDAVVLLGGLVDEEAMEASGQASYNDNVERLVATHRLLRAGKARYAILSGAALDEELRPYGEAVVLARQLEDWGIAPDRLVVEDKARNTRENAVYSQQIARARGFERVLIVTSAFHMVRAAECFAAVDMKVDTLAVDYRAHARAREGLARWLPRAQQLATSVAVFREVFGRAVYRVQGYGKSAP